MPDNPRFERRKFVRIDGSFVVSYRYVTENEPRMDVSQTKNISLGGILFTTDRKFEPGAVLKVQVRIPDQPDYVSIKVRVIESEERVKNVLYDTRAEFIGMSKEDRDVVTKFVEYYSKGKEGQS